MINNIILQGRFTKEPEIKILPSGVELTTGRIAWSEKYKENEVKLFIDIKAWRGTAKFIANYFHQGSEILLEGRLETEEWTTVSGENRSKVTFSVERAHFCGKKDTANAENGSFDAAPINIDPEELPF